MLEIEQNQVISGPVPPNPVREIDPTGPFLPTCGGCIARSIGVCPGYGVKDFRGASGQGRIASVSQMFPPRRQILHQREMTETVPVICSGWAAATVSMPNGKRQVVSFLLGGEIASINYVFESCGGRMIEAVSAVMCRKFPRAAFQETLLNHPAATGLVGKALAAERERNDQLNLDLSKRSAESRIARLILSMLARLPGRAGASGASFDFPPRQQQLADALGLTAVHVCKVFSRLRSAGLLSLKGRRVTILDDKALRDLAEQ